ncbi:type I Zorya anti-phage system protein ZorD [Pseudomonas sp. URMO17WK12:I4]|uniref:type I Zorya anti-phage system protein ZorD n=1 Tax=Pseudomonas sp. URMO17WK12:I4 TaxID=1283292 RepID=UPI00047FF229|nr:type I Zorya anti-phage system protein ZorD [Pseudomonas sp. URMO17WK12:I4]
MLKRFFSGKGQRTPQAVAAPVVWTMEEQGLCYALSLADDEAHWQLAAYLDQLFEEDFASQLSDRWLLPWDSIYQLLDDPEHVSSLALLGLPPLSRLQPQLASEGSLAEAGFKVFQTWRDPARGAPVEVERCGAIAHAAGGIELLPQSVWELLQAVRALHTAQQASPGEATNQLGWSNIRRLAKRAGAGMDGFLDKTVVVKPQSLQLKPRKKMIGTTPVIELDVAFDGQPSNWLASFDAYKQVQNSYRVPSEDGSVTHVLIEPEVKAVLESVRALPGRRVAGEEGVSLLRNPFSFIGDEAAKVVDSDEYQSALADEGIYFHRFRLEPKLAEDAKTIQGVELLLEPISATPLHEVALSFNAPYELTPFVHALEVNLAVGLPASSWQGHELELSDFDLVQLAGIKELLRGWQNQVDGKTFEAVIDLSSYGNRVVGIGEAERITSPFLVKEATENWLPAEIKTLGIDAELLSKWDASNREHFEAFERSLDEVRAAGDETVPLPGTDLSLPLKAAEQLFDTWSKKLNPVEALSSLGTTKAARAVLQIENNIEEATYAERREAALLAGRQAHADLPELLRPEIQLREHQLKGVAWMQHLFGLSPTHVAGCLLADDMGLGKTIQLLTFLVWYLEKNPDDKPTLIVAPVSLLDNWERELERFFYADALPVLKLYGNALSAVKFKKEEIPEETKARGIQNLLRPGWIGNARIVLTTYETLRDQEFSLAMQQWAIVVCDEAQKIKNPAALITQAAKAIPARFRVACTGTPVENTLIDLWCLFDFIQPGFLGGLNQFGREYQRPIEAGAERDSGALERLRGLIEPQTLRRTKQDVAKDLPAKLVDKACRTLSMHALQRSLYLSEVASYSQKQQMQELIEQKESGMLGLLHRLKLVCAHPYSVQPDQRLRDHSPKLQWLLQTLEGIKRAGNGDKVIVFSELRDIQRELQHAIHERFGFKATVINGDTSTSSQSAQSRQKLIDQFQQQPGFSVIILSTVAVGFGVNVQAANHVIHFTRCWNPAKEDQATDRAYRIGQEKDVYVYYPTVLDHSMPTFEATLDQLLEKRRALAQDMLHGSSEIQVAEFGELLRAQG